jgi:DNA repair protein RecO
MIHTTDAVVLRVSPFSRTSHVVTWLSPEHGRVVTAVRGACRPKSAFLGQYDLGYTCELLFYAREREGVHAIRSCAPLRLREGLRGDWRAAAAAAYLCDLASRIVQPRLPAGEIAQALEAALDRLAEGEPALPVILACEAALLRQAGLAPNLGPCPACSAADGETCRFALASGRPACHRTAPAAPGEATVAVTPALLRALADWLRTGPGDTPPHTAVSPQVALGLRRFLGIFMDFHLDVPPAVRQAALSWTEFEPARTDGRTGRGEQA